MFAFGHLIFELSLNKKPMKANMYTQIKTDENNFNSLLDQALAMTRQYLEGLDERSPNAEMPNEDQLALPGEGRGAAYALRTFQEKYGEHLLASAGPRYFGYVTGGTTPAAFLGDWLTTASCKASASPW